jgi:ParB family chromosome partitioning protein
MPDAPATGDESLRGGSVQATMLPVDELRPNPFQPRNNVSEQDVVSLAESIERKGLLQPIAVRRRDDRYEIIAGERRWVAAKSLGISQVPAVVRDASDEEMLELALIENIQREDLNAIDRAMAYREFCSRFGLKPEEVAQRLGEDRTTVVNYLRLLDLPEGIRSMVADGRLSMGHARCLLGVADETQGLELAESVVQNELSVRALEEIVRREKTRQGGEAATPETRGLRSAHLRDLERQFEQAIKTKVTLHEGKRKGTGRIIIEYYTLDDFDRIASALGVTLE